MYSGNVWICMRSSIYVTVRSSDFFLAFFQCVRLQPYLWVFYTKSPPCCVNSCSALHNLHVRITSGVVYDYDFKGFSNVIVMLNFVCWNKLVMLKGKNVTFIFECTISSTLGWPGAWPKTINALKPRHFSLHKFQSGDQDLRKWHL